MTKDKHIEEMVMVLTELQHAFDRAWKECLHNNAPMPDRENVFYAKYLVEKEGYRKASDVAREIFEEIATAFIKYYDSTITYSSPTLPYHTREAVGFSLNEMFMKILELKKKYTEGEKCQEY